MNTDTQNKTLNVVDLFSGAGGLSVGFEEAGLNVVCGVDVDSSSLETWRANHDGEVVEADISTRSPQELVDNLEISRDEIDVVIGGPPCKDFTKANQKVDLGRNNLVVLFAEYVSYIQPDAFVMENVRQITTKYEDVLESMYSTLEDSFNLSHRLLDAADYGVPQHRLRAFVIGLSDSFEQEPQFPAPTHGPDSESERELVTAGSALSDISEPDDGDMYSVTSSDADLLPDIPPGLNYSFYTEKLGHPEPRFEWRSRFSDYLYKADPEKPVRTLKAKPGAASGPFHWNNRKFTECELMRLQSFPDDFVFPHEYTEIVRQIGNSVPPAQAFSIAKSIERQVRYHNSLISADADLGFYSRRRTSSEEYQQKAKDRLEKLGFDDNPSLG